MKLKNAFALCKIKLDPNSVAKHYNTDIYFKTEVDSSKRIPKVFYINLKKLLNDVDISTIEIRHIEPYFSLDGFEGFVFTIRTTDSTLCKLKMR